VTCGKYRNSFPGGSEENRSLLLVFQLRFDPSDSRIRVRSIAHAQACALVSIFIKLYEATRLNYVLTSLNSVA
jgi:hypothetical protein